jgi:hypothetical protein
VISPEVAIKMLGTLGGADVPHESMTGVRIDNVDGPGFVSRLSLGEFPSNFSAANPVVLTPARSQFYAKQLLTVLVQREDLEDFMNQSRGMACIAKEGRRDDKKCHMPDYRRAVGAGGIGLSCDVQFAGLRIACLLHHCNASRLIVMKGWTRSIQ